jgi:hypothetical protein
MIPLPSLAPSLDAVASALDACSVSEQLHWMHGLGKREMARLYELGGPVPLEWFVAEEGVIVEHEGQNSLLPGIDRFEKHMVRRNGVLQGYNRQSFGWLVGPGHFTLREQDGTTVFDYTAPPTDAPSHWPTVVPNDKGLSNLVYGGMVDVMRRVSSCIVVGKAYRRGKEEGAYFLLFRRSQA